MRPAADGLDNPFWSCLATRHAHLARGDALARRYPAEISSLAGLSGHAAINIAALESLVGVGDDTVVVGPFIPKLGAHWQIVHAGELTQMVRADRTPLPEGDFDVERLGASDVEELLALVEITQPGPFRKRTIDLGHFIGIRDGGRLVAMAGERTWIGDHHEVSGVCTHPDVRGRGYARALIGSVVNRMLRAGETPFLHAEVQKPRAIAVYESLGFAERTRFPLLAARRIG